MNWAHRQRRSFASWASAEQTFYRWKRRYAGLEPSQVRELNQLREENARLKKLVADLSLDKAMLSDVVKKKW